MSRYEVIVRVKIRENPNLQAAELGYLEVGEIIEADDASLVLQDSHYWLQHERGWSARNHATNTALVYLVAAEEQPIDWRKIAEAARWAKEAELQAQQAHLAAATAAERAAAAWAIIAEELSPETMAPQQVAASVATAGPPLGEQAGGN